jgi:predicted RNA methylase
MTFMDSIKDRLTRSIAQRGIWGTICLCAVTVGWKILPNFRRVEQRQRQADESFDSKYGVDTGGVFRPKRDEVVGENWALGGNYQAIDPSAFEEALSKVDIAREDFTFIDIGSGKGRTVLIASRYPFRRVIGVEYCPKLNELARQNVSRFPVSEKRCGSIEVVDADGAKYQIPNDPLVLFLNNPFGEPVMEKVVENVVASFKRHPRRIVVIYFWPNHADLWDRAGIFQRLQEAPAIYDTGPVARNNRQQRESGAREFAASHREQES